MARLIFFLLICSARVWGADDFDRDGVEDAFEQRLLDRFAPILMISAKECDVLPAEFLSGSAEPRVVAKNGLLYGQVFRNDTNFEIHYYHLWERDCGPAGHKLDTERVSVLVDSETGKALFWYAAAHEGTVCDASRAAKAVDLNAEDRGATVWISHGKHASYLTESGWGLGCGGDAIEDPAPFHPIGIVNIGEPLVPLNGAVWIHSEAWPLKGKMDPDFTQGRIARLADPERTGDIAMNDAVPPVKALVLGANMGLKGAVVANTEAGAHTGNALVVAVKKAFGWIF
jgi:hypothetical protein